MWFTGQGGPDVRGSPGPLQERNGCSNVITMLVLPRSNQRTGTPSIVLLSGHRNSMHASGLRSSRVHKYTGHIKSRQPVSFNLDASFRIKISAWECPIKVLYRRLCAESWKWSRFRLSSGCCEAPTRVLGWRGYLVPCLRVSSLCTSH